MLKKGKTPVSRKKRTIEIPKIIEIKQNIVYVQDKYGMNLYETHFKHVEQHEI